MLSDKAGLASDTEKAEYTAAGELQPLGRDASLILSLPV